MTVEGAPGRVTRRVERITGSGPPCNAPASASGIAMPVLLWRGPHPPGCRRKGASVTTTREHPGRLRRFHEKFLVEERVVPASAKRNLYIVAVVLIAAGLAAFLFIFDSVLEADDISTVDAPVERWLETGQSDWLTTVMTVIAFVFGPIVMPIIILVTIVTWGFVAKHAWRPSSSRGACSSAWSSCRCSRR